MKKRHGKTNEQYAFTRDYVATSSPVNLAASNIKDIFFCHILYLLLSLDIYSLFSFGIILTATLGRVSDKVSKHWKVR